MRLSRQEVLAAAIGVTAGCTRGANSETPAAETTTTAPGAAATSTEAAQGPEILDLSPAPPDRMPAVQFSLGVASRLHATDSAVIWRRLDPRVGPVDTVEGQSPQQSPKRSLRWGEVAELIVLDTRLHRSSKVAIPDRREINTDMAGTDRTMLGIEQRELLFDRLAVTQDEGMTWRILASSVPIAPDAIHTEGKPDRSRTYDTWDGFPHERDLLVEQAGARGGNVISLAGDRHVFLAAEFGQREGGAESSPAIREFLGSGISSGVAGLDPEPRAPISFSHRLNGVSLVELNSNGASVEFWGCNAADPRSTPSLVRRFEFDSD